MAKGTKESQNNVEFDALACEELKYYVYALVDPRDGKIFYVGKGKGNRVFQHVKDALGKETESDKLDIIRKIIDEGKDVQYYILRHGLTESQAFEMESLMIDFLTYDKFKKDVANITNIVAGHHTDIRGIMSIDDVRDFLNAEKIENLAGILAPYGNVLAISINGTYTSGASEDEVYKAVRRSWSVNLSRVKKCKYVLAVANGIIRGVFVPEPNSWRLVPEDGENKREFDKKKKLSKEEKEGLKELKEQVCNRRANIGFGSGQPLKYFEKLYSVARTLKPYGNVLAISINDTYKPGACEDEVYKAVCSAWRIDLNNAQQIDYVLAVAKGIIRGVFIPKEWHIVTLPDDNKRKQFVRKEFLTDDEQKTYKKLKEKVLDKAADFNFGKGQPLRYVNGILEDKQKKSK